MIVLKKKVEKRPVRRVWGFEHFVPGSRSLPSDPAPPGLHRAGESQASVPTLVLRLTKCPHVGESQEGRHAFLSARPLESLPLLLSSRGARLPRPPPPAGLQVPRAGCWPGRASYNGGCNPVRLVKLTVRVPREPAVAHPGAHALGQSFRSLVCTLVS